MKLPNERIDEKVMEEVIKVDKRKFADKVAGNCFNVLNWRWSKKSPPKKRAQKSPVKMTAQKLPVKMIAQKSPPRTREQIGEGRIMETFEQVHEV